MSDQNTPIGARAKRKMARQLYAEGRLDLNFENRVSTRRDRFLANLFIFALALALAWLLTDKVFQDGFASKTGFAFFDRYALAAAPVPLFGMPWVDFIILILARAVLILVAAGILPLVAWIWMELLDRPDLSPLRVVWGATVALGVLYLALGPVFRTIVSNMQQLVQ